MFKKYYGIDNHISITLGRCCVHLLAFVKRHFHARPMHIQSLVHLNAFLYMPDSSKATGEGIVPKLSIRTSNAIFFCRRQGSLKYKK